MFASPGSCLTIRITRCGVLRNYRGVDSIPARGPKNFIYIARNITLNYFYDLKYLFSGAPGMDSNHQPEMPWQGD